MEGRDAGEGATIYHTYPTSPIKGEEIHIRCF